MLRMALLGPGKWGSRLAGSVQGNSQKLRFVAAGSREPERHTEFGEQFGLAVTTHDAVIADPGIDAVLIATPHSEHVDQGVAAAMAGKHIFIEKPLALTADGARRIIASCENAGVKLAHGFNRRFAPSYLEMLRRLHDGEIGELIHLEGQFSGPSGYPLKPGAWRADRSECPAGAMTARGIHPLDTMISMAGPVTSVYAHSDHRVVTADVDDVTSALLRFGSGASGYIASHHVTAEIWRVHIYGTKGWMEMRGDTELTIKTLDGGPEQTALTAADKERAELEAFADYVAGGAAYPVSNAQALNGVAVIEAMTSSAASGHPVRIA